MSTSSKKIVLKKLVSHNTIWHPESTLVFKSQKDKLVIGRYVNDEIIPLDDNALQLCELWKFKPDESLIDEQEDEQENNQGDDQEDEQEDDQEDDEHENNQEDEVKNEVKSEVKSEDWDDIKNLQNITETFNSQMYTCFKNLLHEKKCLSDQLNQKEVELDDLQKKYDDFKKKFDVMKSLFN